MEQTVRQIDRCARQLEALELYQFVVLCCVEMLLKEEEEERKKGDDREAIWRIICVAIASTHIPVHNTRGDPLRLLS